MVETVSQRMAVIPMYWNRLSREAIQHNIDELSHKRGGLSIGGIVVIRSANKRTVRGANSDYLRRVL